MNIAVSADGGNYDGDVTGSRRCRGSGIEVENTTVSAYVGNDVGVDVTSSCTATAVVYTTANDAVLFDGPELSATRSHHNNQRRCTWPLVVRTLSRCVSVHWQFRYQRLYLVAELQQRLTMSTTEVISARASWAAVDTSHFDPVSQVNRQVTMACAACGMRSMQAGEQGEWVYMHEVYTHFTW